MKHEVHGAGPTLLLVRPLAGPMALWGEFRAQLARTFRVISFELPVSTTRGIALAAIGLLDQLGIDRAHVFGISLGSMVAQWIAIDHPARVDRLCLASTCARGIEFTRAGIQRELGMAASFLHRSSEVEPHVVDRVLSKRFRSERPDEVQRIEAVVRATPSSRTRLAALALAGVRHDTRGRLSSITASTLVLAGSDDALFGTEPSREVSTLIPRADFAIIRDAGHDVTLERPVKTATRVAAHFA